MREAIFLAMTASTSDLIAKHGSECVCPKCPSFTICAKMRWQSIFCLSGKSPTDCIRVERGCLCLECAVASALGKDKQYYCMYQA